MSIYEKKLYVTWVFFIDNMLTFEVISKFLPGLQLSLSKPLFLKKSSQIRPN